MREEHTTQTPTPWERLRQSAYNASLRRRKIEKLTQGQLERCLRAPTLIREIRGPEWIVCPLCGGLFKRLSRHLPEHVTGLSAEVAKLSSNSRYSGCSRVRVIGLAFRKKFGLAKRFP